MTNFYTPGIYALESGGWAYAPWGDIYALTPLWGESHGITGDVIHTEDEVNRYAIVGHYDAPTDPFFLLAVTFDNPDTVAIEEDIPTGTPALASRIWVNSGFNEEKELGISLVLDDEDEWTGEFKVVFTEAVRKWVGVGRVAQFSIDYWTEETPETRTRIAFGTVVFRR